MVWFVIPMFIQHDTDLVKQQISPIILDALPPCPTVTTEAKRRKRKKGFKELSEDASEDISSNIPAGAGVLEEDEDEQDAD